MRLLLDLKVKKSSILLAVYLFSMFLPGYFSSPIMQMVSNIMMVGVAIYLFSVKYKPSRFMILTICYFAYLIVITFIYHNTVIAAIVLVAFMISLPQIEANKNARNISTVIYLCHPWIIFAVGSLEHFEIACNGWVKVVISMIMSICTAFLVVKMSNKFKIIRKFI